MTIVVAPGEDVSVEGEGAFQDWELIAVYERCRDRLYTYKEDE